ncbi:MAG TPA: SapC family protein [Allosphingosinicella sp.]|nr:SapC family protein [Allosphingosinicella sp.]
MATEPPSNPLPIFYGGLEPLSSSVHAGHRSKPSDRAPFLVNQHAVPITVDEFVAVQRFYPIVFSVGENPVPLALMGLNEGVNVFVDDEGKVIGETYLPAYIRRYPYMLARLSPEAQELSLCFDPTSGLVGEFDEGEALFDDGKPSEATNSILKFCEEFELSAQRTVAFMADLKAAELLMDGEVSIQPAGAEQPFVYRGFQMVNEEKLRELTGEQTEQMNKNGMLPLIYAHLFSMSLVREIFARQIQQGKGPQGAGLGAAAPAAGNA